MTWKSLVTNDSCTLLSGHVDFIEVCYCYRCRHIFTITYRVSIIYIYINYTVFKSNILSLINLLVNTVTFCVPLCGVEIWTDFIFTVFCCTWCLWDSFISLTSIDGWPRGCQDVLTKESGAFFSVGGSIAEVAEPNFCLHIFSCLRLL